MNTTSHDVLFVSSVLDQFAIVDIYGAISKSKGAPSSIATFKC